MKQVESMIKIDNGNYMSVSQFKEYHRKNKGQFIQGLAHDIKVDIVLNRYGYCTCISEHGNVLKFWAGEIAIV